MPNFQQTVSTQPRKLVSSKGRLPSRLSRPTSILLVDCRQTKCAQKGPTRTPATAFGRSGRPHLQQSKCAQIFAWLVKATAAERRHELPSILQSTGIDFPIAPREKFVSK